jgi:hypothetical protein
MRNKQIYPAGARRLDFNATEKGKMYLYFVNTYQPFPRDKRQEHYEQTQAPKGLSAPSPQHG